MKVTRRVRRCGSRWSLLLAVSQLCACWSSQLCVQGSKTDQIIELGIRTVGDLRWLVRPRK